MTVLPRLVSTLATAASAALVLSTVATGPASARTVDERCWGRAPLPAAALAQVAAGCSVVGRTVYRGGVSVVVPPAGVTVEGEGLSTRGGVEGLRVTNSGHGVTATTGQARSGGSGAGAAGKVTSPPACQDRAFRLEGHAWRSTYRYHVDLAKMPRRFHAKTVVGQVRAANFHLRAGTNTCGRPRIGTPGADYRGRTTTRPDIKVTDTTVGCGHYNTTNVVGFGNLPGNLLGWTCFWWVDGGRIDAADVMMDNGAVLTTHLPDPCSQRWDFEGAVTHEMGHVYGLDHTGSGHANLTMQHLLRPCSTYARTLGLGDWLGMKKLYGVR